MFWQRRSPEYLLSGKIVCGACGGPFSVVSARYYRCNAAGRGLCGNKASIRRDRLEEQVIQVLATELMDPGRAAEFAEAFTTEWNRLAVERGARGEGLRRELAAAERKLNNVLEAIAEGLRSPGLQAKLATLETQRAQLAQAAAASQPTPIRLLPNLGEAYRRRLAKLSDRLTGAPSDREALQTARRLIERVVVHPGPPRKPPGITVEGHLAHMLAAAQPDLPAHAAMAIAQSAHLSAKEGPGASCPRQGAQGDGVPLRPTRAAARRPPARRR
jgi:site-specific DNA recombinase